MNKLIINSVIFAVLLNVIFSYALGFIATPQEIKPPHGAAKLNFKEQIMHMFVHHKQVILASSIIVAFVVAISVGLALKLPILNLKGLKV